jgi:hypothetical protein
MASESSVWDSSRATPEADIRRPTEYSELVHRYQASLSDREALERDADAVEERIRAYGIKRVDAEGNVRALEQRCLEYLRELCIPNLSPAELQVHITGVPTCPRCRAGPSRLCPVRASRPWSTSPTPWHVTRSRSTGDCHCPG